MNESLLEDLLPGESPELVVAYNGAFNDAIAKHLNSKDNTFNATGNDIAAMSDKEFVDYVETGARQPIVPFAVACEILGLPEDTPVVDVMRAFKSESDKLIAQYEGNKVDGRTALLAASNIIGHTEAYITGYSREIGVLVSKLVSIDPSLNAAMRWNGKIWVPEEDGHDRLWRLLMLGSDIDDIARFDRDHNRHLQIGTHLPVRSIVSTHLYVTKQETDTVTSYFNIARLYGPVLHKVAKRIKDDEALHSRDYTDVTIPMIEAEPDVMVINLEKEFNNFDMPGREGIDNYDAKSKIAGITGILDPVSMLRTQQRLITRLGIKSAEVTSDDAKTAKERLLDPDGKYGEKAMARAQRLMEKIRERAVVSAEKAGGLLPAILGVTVDCDPSTHELSFPWDKAA